MSNTRHLKRSNMPTSWSVKRKNIRFITRPKPGSYKSKYVISMLNFLRDEMKFCSNTKEAVYAIKNTEILVNGKKCDDVKLPIGFFDIVEIKKISKTYTIFFNELGNIKIIETKDKKIPRKVMGKSVIRNGKYQINTLSGLNVLVDKKTFDSIRVNDSIIYDTDKKKIDKVIALKKGAKVYLYDGRYKGQFGEVLDILENQKSKKILLLLLKQNQESIKLLKDFALEFWRSLNKNGRS